MQHKNIVYLVNKMVCKSSLTAVAAELNVSKSYLSEFLSGKKNVGHKLLTELGYEVHYKRVKK